MTSSDKQNDLWAALSQEAEASRPCGLAAPSPTGSQRLSFGDRLAQHILSGFVSLFLVGSLVAFIACLGPVDHPSIPILAGYDGGLLIVFGMVTALFWSWFFVPWSGGHQRSKMWRLIPLSFAVVFFNLLSMTVTEVFINHLTLSKQLSLLESVIVWQTYLQRALGAGATLALFCIAILSICLIPFTKARYPWAQPTSWSKKRKGLPLVLIFFFVALALFISRGLRTPAFDAWQETVPLLLDQANWPEDITGDEEVWSKRGKSWEEAAKLKIEKRRSERARILREVLGALPDAEKVYELDRFRILRLLQTLTAQSEIALSQEQIATISYWRIFHLTATRESNQQWRCAEELDKKLIPYLLGVQLETSELESWLLKAKKLSSLLIQDESDERNLNVYDYFSKKDFHLETYRTDYRLEPIPAPGSSFKPSPYVLAKTYKLAQQKRAWMKLHGDFQPMTSADAASLIDSLDDNDPSLRESYGISSELAAELAGRRYTSYLKPQYQGLELLIELRLAKLKTGAYPRTLDKLVSAKNISSWDWMQQDGQWTLRHNVYPEHGQTWLLP